MFIYVWSACITLRSGGIDVDQIAMSVEGLSCGEENVKESLQDILPGDETYELELGEDEGICALCSESFEAPLYY